MDNFLEKLQEINKDLYVNTSYPRSKSDWKKFQKNVDIFNEINDFSVYIHIPFCKHLCKFCEYTKCVKQTEEKENKVIDTLIKDIDNFKLPNTLYGLDIGGGTPTCLTDKNFKRIVDKADFIIDNSKKPDDFIASIEATFDTLNDEKIEILKDSNIKRISFGLQVYKKSFLEDNERNSNIELIKNVLDKIKNDFIINIDLMYGLNNINKEDLKATIEFVHTLNVEQVTLYEMRYNMVDIKPSKDKEEIVNEYDFCYKLLNNLGYNAPYGRNTFSTGADEGVSSYLKYRMCGFFYKGFGPSAQSMTNIGISYNIFKNHCDIDLLLKVDTFEGGDIYMLPKKELLGKLISIALYRCKIDIKAIKELYDIDLLNKSFENIKELRNLGFILVTNDEITITESGYKYYSAIGYFLYSKTPA